jgi:hypothetical protein
MRLKLAVFGLHCAMSVSELAWWLLVTLPDRLLARR